jgi:hypothetical protein
MDEFAKDVETLFPFALGDLVGGSLHCQECDSIDVHVETDVLIIVDNGEAEL